MVIWKKIKYFLITKKKKNIFIVFKLNTIIDLFIMQKILTNLKYNIIMFSYLSACKYTNVYIQYYLILITCSIKYYELSNQVNCLLNSSTSSLLLLICIFNKTYQTYVNKFCPRVHIIILTENMFVFVINNIIKKSDAAKEGIQVK